MDFLQTAGLTEPAREAKRDALRGEVAFASPEAQIQRTTELLGASALIVDVAPLPVEKRGKLADHIDEHVERSLAASGAPSPYLTAWSTMPGSAADRLADQLFRARTVGASGVVLALGSLTASATPAIAPEDSATLVALANATKQSPLVLLLDDADVAVGAYAEPVALASLLDRPVHRVVEPRIETMIEALVETPAPSVAAPMIAPIAAPVVAPIVAPVVEQAPIVEREVAAAVAGVPIAGPSDFWRGWVLALSAARGPQTLATFERLFAESYVPLAAAIAAGLDDARALRAYNEFRQTFERAYTDAFATFGVTTRRPRLVMDVYDLVSKQSRLHNARSAHVLVVDGMRFDLGCLVRDVIANRAPGLVALASETILFSALPTTTFRQLETIARGIDALRAPGEAEPMESLRGRPAEIIRRLRVGPRELYKLDVVPAALDSAALDRNNIGPSFDAIAEKVGTIVIEHAKTLAPRTLLFVLGDHGFAIDRKGAVSQGGASPEEALVPAFSYLVGSVH